MPDHTFEWLLFHPEVMREYAFQWIAVSANGVIAASDQLERLILQVDGEASMGDVRYVFAYAPQEL